MEQKGKKCVKDNIKIIGKGENGKNGKRKSETKIYSIRKEKKQFAKKVPANCREK